jgi:lipopolysaccharide export system protein LptA
MTFCRVARVLTAVAIVAVAATGAAVAQQPKQAQPQGPQNALQGFSQNRDQPVKIKAASLEVRDKDKVATFSGDVHVVNGDTELRCKSLRVFYDDDSKTDSKAGGMKTADPGPGGNRQIARIEANGGVTVVQKDQHATGESAIFNMRENTVALTGNVVVVRGTDVLRGRKLTVDLTSGVSRVEGAEAVIVPRNPEKK